MDLYGHLAFALICASYLFRDILWLRVLSIFASLAGIVYNYYEPHSPLWLVIYWNCVFIAVNAIQIAILLYERRAISLTDPERLLYQTVFSCMPPVEFRMLLRRARWRKGEPGQVLAIEGERLATLMLIHDGQAEVVARGAVLAELGPGQFVGEMTFLNDQPATATVRLSKTTHFVEWDRAELRTLLSRHPTLHLALEAVFNSDLTEKLKRQSRG